MAKKIIDNTPIQNFEDPWGGTYESGPNAGKEWGKSHAEVERVIKEKASSLENDIEDRVIDVYVNNTPAVKNGGRVHIDVPALSSDVTNPSNPNAAQAGAVAAELNGIKGGLVVNARQGAISPDGSEVTLEFLNSENDVVFDINIPAAQEAGEVIYPVMNATRISPAQIKLGDNVRVSWQYDCLSNRQQGSVTEYTAKVNVKVQMTNDSGTTTIKEQILGTSIIAGSTPQQFVVDASEITTRGTLRVIFTATTEINGEVKTAQRTVTFTIVVLSLNTDFNPSIGLAANGGYVAGDTVTIPYSYSVPQNTTLKAWLNGVLVFTEQISGTSVSRLTGIGYDDLQDGRNNIQLIAMESMGLMSNVISIDIRKSGDTTDFLGLVLNVSSDNLEDIEDMPLPYAYGNTGMNLYVNQFSSVEIPFAAWRNGSASSQVVVSVDGTVTQTLTVNRSRQTLVQRFDEVGQHTLSITMGTCTWSLGVEVISVGSVTESVIGGFINSLSSVGRNNSLDDREDWGGVTTLSGVDFSTNGWIDDTLLLTNGATAEIDIKPFAIYGSGNGIHEIGLTVEVELMVSKVVERGATILHCLWDNAQSKGYDPADDGSYPRGIKVTTDKASLLFGGTESIHTAEKMMDADGNYIRLNPSTEQYETCSESEADDLYVTRPYGAEMFIAEDKWMHLAFVIQPIAGTPNLLGMLYINGVLSRVNRFANNAADAYNMVQLTPVGISISSEMADVRIRTLRYYRASLDRDQVLSNYIATLHTAAEMQAAHDRNDVGGVDDYNQATISRTALIDTKKRGVLTIVKSQKKLTSTVYSDLRELFENGISKSEDFCADYIKWTPPCDANGDPIGEGFEAWYVNIRIQGTSSVNYPYKNIRIYLAKTNFNTPSTTARVRVGGKTYVYNSSTKKMVFTDGGASENFDGYCIRGAAISKPQAVLCAKTDFVDSSLVLNTGGAHLFNDKMRDLGLTTPPMEIDSKVRQAIDGIPCDLYAGTSESGPFTYFGQFVLNNEKSKSGVIFGMEKVSGFTPTCPIALESLENRLELTLFQSAGQSTADGGTSAENDALENQLEASFDDAFEFNFPEDTYWTQAKANDEDGSVATSAQKTAIRRLMSFIYRCVKDSNVNMSSPEYGDRNGWSSTDKAKWHSAYFREHVGEYFDVDYLCTYYLFTEYWASVDQRAKNILWRTWDGNIWFPTYYDGDTAMSIRNDAFMVYLYDVTRDTYDLERSKYAFEGHDSWLWCLLLANVEYGTPQTNPIYDRLAVRARAFREQVTLDAMLNEFNNVMMWNWSERQYNYSQKLKYIDTMDVKYYPYTLTGNREAHRTQFLTERSALLDAQYTAGDYMSDRFSFYGNRLASDTPNTIVIKSGDLYYFGVVDVHGTNWFVRPIRAEMGETITLTIQQALNGASGVTYLQGASKIRELDFTGMRNNMTPAGFDLSPCTMLEKFVYTSTGNVRFGGTMRLGNTSKLLYVELTGQTGINNGQNNTLDFSKHTRLNTVLLSGTGLTSLILPEGAPITTLALPDTLGTLTLHNLPLLTMSGITVDGDTWTGFTGLNLANCPNIDWITILQRCTNVRQIRIEGMRGEIYSSLILPFVNGWNPNTPNDYSNLVYKGLNTDGTINELPQFPNGEVTFIDVVGLDGYTFEQLQDFFGRCGLVINQPQYSHYWFADEEIDPSNITNEDNRTGWAYFDSEEFADENTPIPDGYASKAAFLQAHPNGYFASGHVVLLRNRCKPVLGKINDVSGKMVLTELSKANYAKKADGETAADITSGDSGDVFIYIPRYWYKGVNNYKNGTKHFFISSSENQPLPSYNRLLRVKLSVLATTDNEYGGLCFPNMVTHKEMFTKNHDGVTLDENSYLIDENQLFSESGYTAYRVNVEGMKQVRFPSNNNENYCCVFTNRDGRVLDFHYLVTPDIDDGNGTNINPHDFNGSCGCYDFRNIPDGCVYCWFTCRSTFYDNITVIDEVIAVDSNKLDAIEPDWVEHKPELVGVYQGSFDVVDNVPQSGVRSLRGKTIIINTEGDARYNGWTYGDGRLLTSTLPTTAIGKSHSENMLNLCLLRGDGYSSVPYETAKNLANLFFAYCGTRKAYSVFGFKSGKDYTTGYSATSFRDTPYSNGGGNAIWGIEGWLSCIAEGLEYACNRCVSYSQYMNNGRGMSIGSVFAIKRQDGTDNVLRYESYQAGRVDLRGISRVFFGKYCDIIKSSHGVAQNFNYCYSAGEGNRATDSAIPMRGGRQNAAGFNLISLFNESKWSTHTASIWFEGVRLCYTGELENEPDVNDQIIVMIFEDPNVKTICVSNFGGNSYASQITHEEAAAVTSLGGFFQANTAITKFNELQYFKGITSLGLDQDEGQFFNCTNLTEVTIPVASIGNFRGSFRQCSKLKSVDLSPTTATNNINIRAAFLGCSALERVTLPGGTYASENMYRAFFGCGKLTTININGIADWSNVSRFQDTFNISNSVLSTITGAITGIKVDIDLSACPLTKASALVILNGLDTASGKTVTFKASTYAQLTADDIAIATNKGWTVASA